ncbi:hypothetical protein H4R33_002093 [Dimargaris cristalligena]|uniref:NADH-ubiquinone reductase complex 1 MLRQ subunit-domain-containing protein n=1 Tax=Dimargaris cristalligena TaxID=215637 RepID=A0A4Q0A194_9FUNG|nr:hypothetical protein H4R33_002093 [Dimargaris cristalligena]RKP39797.1 NADH-ubiquinone reductase complex 1 MLRQ subunit-domain-containing protein [Dimargaris cristalligena]|eukprot:RKP39797.1 NADH-ubiquinone reductase complex 1 MLRQ subunit-domain-containing protein [Dimargaris cristalligena]
MTSPAMQQFLKRWYAVEVLPIIGIMTFAVGGAGWYLTRLARGPEVAWDKKNNPYPWLHIKQDENAKLMSVSHDFARSWNRDRF